MSTTPSIHRAPTARSEDWRYERKFLIHELRPADVEGLLLAHPAGFSEIFHERVVNNCYFDTARMQHYHDAVDGMRERLKARIRWYGDLFGSVDRPVLELKIKRGLVGSKRSARLHGFTLDPRTRRATLERALAEADVPAWMIEIVAPLQPTLINRYTRRYFRSADGQFRATLDTDLEYFAVGLAHVGASDGFSDRENTVLELKYATGADDAAARITTCFPFRLTKSSKYVAGVERVWLLRG